MVTSKVNFLNSRLLSLIVLNTFNCDGAYPDFEAEYHTYDLRTKEQINLYEEVQSNEALHIYVAEQIKTQSLAISPQCRDLYDIDSLLDEAWTVGLKKQIAAGNKEKIYLTAQPYLAHVANACEHESRILIDDLKSLVIKDSKLDQIIKLTHYPKQRKNK